jgi:heptosyltransferase III
VSGAARIAVIQSGALGDSVLVWPLVRAMVRRGARVDLIARREHARLAAEWIEPGAADGRIFATDLDSAEWSRLWMGAGAVEADARFAGTEVVISFLVDERAGATDAGAAWCAAVRKCFGGARLELVGPPGSASRGRAWAEWSVERDGGVNARANVGGPVVVHVGAGSDAKRWPLERWAELVRRLREGGGRRVIVLAGPVELERFAAAERAMLAEMRAGQEELPEALGLPELARVLSGAAVFIGHDSGPAHLAAQLGVRTIAIFGPTDPAVWSPVGPAVRVVAPGAARTDWAWLSVERVLAEVT